MWFDSFCRRAWETRCSEFSSLFHSAPLLEPAWVDYYSRTELDNETPPSSCPTFIPPFLAVGNLRERATESRQLQSHGSLQYLGIKWKKQHTQSPCQAHSLGSQVLCCGWDHKLEIYRLDVQAAKLDAELWPSELVLGDTSLGDN